MNLTDLFSKFLFSFYLGIQFTLAMLRAREVSQGCRYGEG